MVRSQCFHIPACVLECQQRVARAHACMSCWVPSAMPRGWSVGTSFCRLQVSYGMCAQGVQHRAALRAGAQDGRGQRQARLRAGGVLHAHQAAAGAPGAVAAQRHERELQAQVLRDVRHVLPPHARAVAAGQGARPRPHAPPSHRPRAPPWWQAGVISSGSACGRLLRREDRAGRRTAGCGLVRRRAPLHARRPWRGAPWLGGRGSAERPGARARPSRSPVRPRARAGA